MKVFLKYCREVFISVFHILSLLLILQGNKGALFNILDLQHVGILDFLKLENKCESTAERNTR